MSKQPIIIHYGTQREGFTLRLNPLSLSWLDENYPLRKRLMSVYIGYDRNRPEIHQIQESTWQPIINLLTGLSTEELTQLGGVSIRNPVTDKEIHHSQLVYA